MVRILNKGPYYKSWTDPYESTETVFEYVRQGVWNLKRFEAWKAQVRLVAEVESQPQD